MTTYLETSSIISIHALLAESDEDTNDSSNTDLHFYPRSPCGERLMYALKLAGSMLFLSTLSLRRATDTSSIMQCQAKFLSTLSLRRATKSNKLTGLKLVISIHALLAESDPVCALRVTSNVHFYPRSPCGERRVLTGGLNSDGYFYPRSPCGERPDKHVQWPTQQEISIHALLAESDLLIPSMVVILITFLSTLSLRRATKLFAKRFSNSLFLSTLSLRRAT